MHAVMTGIIAAGTAGKYALAAEQGEVDPGQVETYQKTINAPLNNGGDLTPQQFMWQIKSLMQPVEYTGYKREDRLQRALDRVLALKGEFKRITAKDPHQLMAVNECRSTVLCAEMYFRASLERKETRGWHIREDFADRDDKNFMKWIVMQDHHGTMDLTLEPIPVANYKYLPH
jgi:succinate dehydrogenase/fumarate reductase flavoprotein subunit